MLVVLTFGEFFEEQPFLVLCCVVPPMEHNNNIIRQNRAKETDFLEIDLFAEVGEAQQRRKIFSEVLRIILYTL